MYVSVTVTFPEMSTAAVRVSLFSPAPVTSRGKLRVCMQLLGGGHGFRKQKYFRGHSKFPTWNFIQTCVHAHQKSFSLVEWFLAVPCGETRNLDKTFLPGTVQWTENSLWVSSHFTEVVNCTKMAKDETATAASNSGTFAAGGGSIQTSPAPAISDTVKKRMRFVKSTIP